MSASVSGHTHTLSNTTCRVTALTDTRVFNSTAWDVFYAALMYLWMDQCVSADPLLWCLKCVWRLWMFPWMGSSFRTNVGSGRKERSEAVQCVELHCRLEALIQEHRQNGPKNKKSEAICGWTGRVQDSWARDSFTSWNMSLYCSLSIFCPHLVQFRELKFFVRLRELEYSVN